MRVVHRYLGYFMAGIMTVYAISGTVLVYRDTDFLKREKQYHQTLRPELGNVALGKETGIKELEFTSTNNDTSFFKNGWYIAKTGTVFYTRKELPFFLGKMVSLHKTKSANPLSPLNVLFAATLFFFVVSSFWMFQPKSKIFRRGLIFTTVGLVLALILLFV